MSVSQSLTVTQVSGSQDVANNTSKVRIVWVSTQTGESYNNYTKTAYYWITTPDGVETKYSVSYTLPKGTAKTILDKTITVTHKADGSGTVSVRTWMDTGISAGEVELGPKKITLETIGRDSAITSAADVYLGNACNVKWTPAAKSLRYKLEFILGGWSHTTEVIHPNTTSAYTYKGYIIPLEVAEEITASPSASGKMTVKLYTYSDSEGKAPVGDASSKTFEVTVPQNDDTQPTVTMALSQESSLSSQFNGLYIQGKTKVKAVLTAKAKYEATIKQYYVVAAAGRREVSSSNVITIDLVYSGEQLVVGGAVDTRDFTNYAQETITVIPYSKPRILPVSGETEVVAARCDAEGNFRDNGTYLKIMAKRSYDQVKSGGVQKNFCKIQYRYRVSGGTYTAWETILASASMSSDEVKTGALIGSLATDKSYEVQVQAIDDIGEYGRTTITVPTDKVYWHRDGARRSFSFGGYVEEDNTFAIAEDITFHAKGPIQADGGGNIDTLTLGIKLTASADVPCDLEHIKTPGNYYSPNADNSQHIAHSPYTAGGFGMTVRQMQTTGYIRQELFYGRTTWIRHFDGTDWSDWWRYLTTTVPETPAVDYVIETGVEDGWTWKKWKGGTYEMFGTFEVKPSESTLNGTLYRTNNMTIDVPFKISSAYVSGTAVGFYWITNGGISGTSAITLRIMSDKPLSTTNAIEVRLTVVGTYA